MDLVNYRKEFERDSNRSLSMPLAGLIVWAAVSVVSLFVDLKTSVFIALFSTGVIFPIALLISKLRNELLVSSKNPFAKLMGLCILMVNLLWAIHLPLVFGAIEYAPLTIGIGLGLHWVVYSWIIQHPLGIIHSVVRTLLIVVGWYLSPENPVLGVGIAIVIAYMLSIFMMLKRDVVVD